MTKMEKTRGKKTNKERRKRESGREHEKKLIGTPLAPPPMLVGIIVNLYFIYFIRPIHLGFGNGMPFSCVFH